MARKVFKKLVSLEDALRILMDSFKPSRRVERVDLLDALGRILAEDISSPTNIPPFPRSMVDGYAVRSIDVAGADEENPVSLRIVGRVEVGMNASGIRIGPGEAAEIDTGAMVP
jgi:molybdopterin biosynthesis enzyme